jgi:RNA polymerase sigma factor (sigma-70 family)
MTNELTKALHLALSPSDDRPDGQLLERFVAGRDEVAFEALVRRHGPMVLGVCHRVLHHAHDAEDAFQATFLLLARKATAVVKRDSVGGWLYRVAYHIALEARAVVDRRRARERQVDDMPHPEVVPEEPQDWQPILDRELTRLPEKYRVPLVLYHLEGRTHREVARELSLPEGTLSSRLSTARQMLGRRLARSGVALPAGALVVALSEGAAEAAVPVRLLASTVRAAALLAAGEAALTTPAAALMKGALQTMLLKKLKVVAATAVVVLTLGVGGLAYRAGGQSAPAEKPAPRKPLTELEALRRENQLLKLNLEVVLEKVGALEAELRAFRGKTETPRQRYWKELFEKARLKQLEDPKRYPPKGLGDPKRKPDAPADPKANEYRKFKEKPHADPLTQAEEALKALKAATETEAQRKAADALEKALRSLRGKGKPGTWQDYAPDKPKSHGPSRS